MAAKKTKIKTKKKSIVRRPGGHWRTILSTILGLSGVILLISQISFLFTWGADLTAVDFEKTGETAQNALGKLGAYLGYQTVFKGYGWASFLVALGLIYSGIAIFLKKKPVKLIRYWIWTLIWMFLLSVGAGIFLSHYPLAPGMAGLEASRLMQHFVGYVGSVIIWSGLLFLILVYKFKWEPEHIQKVIPRKMPAGNSIKKPFSKWSDKLKKPSGENTDDTDALEDEDLVDEPEAQEDLQENSGDELADDPDDILIKISSKDETDEEGVSPETEVEIQIGTEEKVKDVNALVEEFGIFDPTLELSNYKYPHFGLLKDYDNTEIVLDKKSVLENKDKIVKTLRDFGIEISKIEATIGPSVTLYEIVPKAGIRISKIKNLENDIALSLAALGIRIIAPMPGRGTIGIEVPNKNPLLVPIKKVLKARKFQESNMDLPVAMGKTISNETFVFDLAKMPHLLIAGATGQGKSVGLNVILHSILYKKHPAEVKFVLIDPKKVEMTLYKKIEKHFLAKLPGEEEAIISDVSKAPLVLNSLLKEMEDRYNLLQKAMVRNIKEYNQKFKERKLNPANGHRFMPYIILVVDEFADLIMTTGKEVEGPITRLAQLARAIGIHIIVATQRPSVKVITGLIKANFPARIAFRVTSAVDSKTILDRGGAEKLIGRGDMLISTGSELTRLQCAFIDTPEVENVTNFIGSQQGFPEAYPLPEPDSSAEEMNMEDEAFERDELFKEAAYIIVGAQQGSASLLQRKLKIGYNRAGRLIDQMEKAGIVGPAEGSKPRKVYIPDLNALDQFFKNEI